MRKRTTSTVVLPPTKTEPDPKGDAPINNTNINGSVNGLSDGINILDAIINIFTTRDTIGFCTIKNYKKAFNLDLNNPRLFKWMIVPFIILDFIQSAFVIL